MAAKGSSTVLINRKLAEYFDSRKDQKVKAAVVATGGGASLAGWMIGTPGASTLLLDFQVPYLQSSLLKYLRLDSPPGKYVSTETSVALAESALILSKQLWLEQHRGDFSVLRGQTFCGLAGTASLISTQPKRGDHKACVSLATEEGVWNYSIVLAKGVRTREEEDCTVSALMLRGLVEATEGNPCDSDGWYSEHVGIWDTVESTFTAKPKPLEALFQGKCSSVLFVPDGDSSSSSTAFRGLVPPTSSLVCCGSFNPLHKGHLDLAATAQAKILAVDGKKLPVLFEISLANADKPSIEQTAVEARVEQFMSKNAAAIVTRAPLFVAKARLMPGSVFVVGADTAKRILDKRYYDGGSESAMVAALAEIKSSGCKFVVGGRVEGGAFLTLEDIFRDKKLPRAIQDMFIGLSSEDFRVDLSSTELRNSQAPGASLVK